MTTESDSRIGQQGLGATLRGLREEKGWSVFDVSERVKFAPRQIEALESERFDELPPGSVVRGLVRSYARVLEMDADRLLSMLDAVYAPEPMRMPPPSLAAPLRRRAPAQAGGTRSAVLFVGLVVVALAVLAGAGWLTMNMGQWTRTTQPGTVPPPGLAVPAQPAATAGDAVLPPAGAAIQPGAAGGAPTGNAPSPVANPPAARPPGAPSSAPVGAAVMATSARPAAADGTKLIRLNFRDASWVEVRQRNGNILFSQLSPAASEKTVAGEPPFSVVIGNAQAVRLEYAGAPVDLRPLTTRDNVARVTLE
jgi:cytoskeleton protein RodZ